MAPFHFTAGSASRSALRSLASNCAAPRRIWPGRLIPSSLKRLTCYWSWRCPCEAKALTAQIKGGASFEEAAKKSSKDPGSAPKGGELDWAAPGNYVPEFSQAMTKLQKGGLTDEPVKSQFGWHILKLDDVRNAQFPAFEEVKPQIQQRLTQQKLQTFRDELKAKAKTNYKFN